MNASARPSQIKAADEALRTLTPSDLFTMKPVPLLAATVGVFLVLPVPAQVPQLLNCQGRVTVGGTNFDGTGLFKFALINTTGSSNYWSNDGTVTGHPAGGGV